MGDSAVVQSIRGSGKPAKLTPARLKAAEFDRTIWRARLENGADLSDIIHPEYWAHVSRQFKPGDIIEVIPDDNTSFTVLYVLAASSNWAKVLELSHKNFLGDDEEQESDAGSDELDFEVKWGGNTDRFRVIRKSDGEVVHSGSPTKADAEKWLTDYKIALNR